MGGPDSALLRAAAQAARQDGVLTRAQIDDAGIPDALLRMLVRAGSWERLLRGTFLVETERDDDERRRSWARAAVLAVPDSAVSHHSAAVQSRPWRAGPGGSACGPVSDRCGSS